MGSFGAVVGATIEDTDEDLAINGPLLVPGIGAQGGTADDVRRIFGDVLDQVLPASSREILSAGPDAGALHDAVGRSVDAFTALRAAGDRRRLSAPRRLPPSPCCCRWPGVAATSVDDYCSDLRGDQKEIADMIESDSPSSLLSHLPMLHDLADKSPDDLDDEWQVFLSALDSLEKAIKEAGVKPSDFQDGKPPAGLSAADRQAIADAANQIRSDEVVQAASGIEQQARDVCKVNLGL